MPFRFPTLSKAIFVPATLILWTIPVSSQSSSCAERSVWVSVTDRNWAPVSSLRPGDFSGEFRGKPVRILDRLPNENKQEIVVLVDASGSMGQGGQRYSAWLLALSLATDIAEAKLANSNLALIIFANGTVEKTDFAAAPQEMAQHLRQIAGDKEYAKTAVKGKTALWDAVGAALDLLKESGKSGTVYAITDGDDNASRLKPNEVRRRLAMENTRFFFSWIDPINFGVRVPEEIGSPEAPQLARESGGAVFGPVAYTQWGPAFAGQAVDPERKISMKAALANFYQDMIASYRLKIQLPQTADHWSQWKLDLSKDARSLHKDYRLGFARDIPPCNPQ